MKKDIIPEEIKIEFAKRFFKESGLDSSYMLESSNYIPIYRDDRYRSYKFFKLFIWDSIKITSQLVSQLKGSKIDLEKRGFKFLTIKNIKKIELKLFNNKHPSEKQLQEIRGY